ncbi:hypothetical protein BGZ73_003998 [Actinomortierella ambigua]|nr:hypothetical protein BGZ73_003998 [Actinomortierella ambigua]
MNTTLSLFCLVDGERTAFPLDIETTKTIGDLKKLIKAEKSPRVDDVAADELTFWKVSIPVVPKKERKEILLDDVVSKEELDETDDLSDVFTETPPKKTIHIIIQRPAPQVVHAPVPSRSLTPVPGYPSDASRPSSPLSGDLLADITKITDEFFAPGSDVARFLDAFVKGKGQLPTTKGNIQGLPRAWRRGYGVAPDNRPSLLCMDLPDPSVPDSTSRNLAAGSILELVQQNNRYNIPIFGVSDDDWGSGDMVTLFNTVRDHLKEVEATTATMDLEINNIFARKTTLLLFLSRLLIFKNCLNINGSSETFNSARWTLLQLCPHVLFKDIFNTLYLKLINLRHHSVLDLSDFVRNVYEDTKDRLIQRGCLPKIKDGTRLLVINDEVQFLCDQFNGSFQSMSSEVSPRPLLSPILHAFRSIGEHQVTLVTCGTGLSINTLFWVQSSGSGLKDSSTTFDYMEFPGWTSKESIKSYISRVQTCLSDEQSKLALLEHLPQDAIDMLFDKFVGRYRPAIACIERIVECNDPGAWKKTIQDAENKLRCMFGNHDLVLNEVDPQLVEHAFGRIKIIRGQAVTVMDEPFVSKAIENYFSAIDPYFAREVRKCMVNATPIEQGCVFERFMMKVFSETFNTRPLSEWPHQPPISVMCPALAGTVEIVGWREPGLEQGTAHAMMSMEDFMDTHVNHGSTLKNMPVAPFFFPKSKPSGPDLVFFIRIDGIRLVPVFVQMKLHQGSSNFSEKDWTNALSTVSATKIEGHVQSFREYCPDNVYISMIVAHPTKWTDKLPTSSELPQDPSGVQQVVINISDDNFAHIFPKEHVEFIDRLKNARKR